MHYSARQNIGLGPAHTAARTSKARRAGSCCVAEGWARCVGVSAAQRTRKRAAYADDDEDSALEETSDSEADSEPAGYGAGGSRRRHGAAAAAAPAVARRPRRQAAARANANIKVCVCVSHNAMHTVLMFQPYSYAAVPACVASVLPVPRLQP